MPDLPPPPAEVEIVIVHPPRLAPLGGDAAFSATLVEMQAADFLPKLAQVAERTGYASPYAFAAAFRRHHGQPPGLWRQQQRERPALSGDSTGHGLLALSVLSAGSLTPWPTGRPCSWLTSLPAISTRIPRTGCLPSSSTSPAATPPVRF